MYKSSVLRTPYNEEKDRQKMRRLNASLWEQMSAPFHGTVGPLAPKEKGNKEKGEEDLRERVVRLTRSE